MTPLAYNLLFLLARYLHIVCGTLLVGGTLFYEMVVPVAIEDLRSEHQLEVMGRSRWVFRWIVWLSVAGILISGVGGAISHWPTYAKAELQVVTVSSATEEVRMPDPRPAMQRPGWWWTAHASSGLISCLIALFLTTGRRPPDSPVGWMRFNLIVLLIVMFLATATQHVRVLMERPPELAPMVQMSPDRDGPTTDNAD